MLRRNTIYTLVLFLLIVSFFIPESYSQEFTQSKGMKLFNRAAYDSASAEIKAYITQHPEEEDIATYYLGESYYNLGMKESQVGLSRDYFRKAYAAFSRVVKYAILQTKNPKIYYSAQLKKGWCYFRRAETGEQPDVELDNAFINFIQVDQEAPDSTRIQAYFMAGESKYKEGIIRKFDSFFPPISLLNINKTISVFQDAEKQYARVLQFLESSSSEKLACEIRLNDIRYQLGKIYQNTSSSLFNNIIADHKKSSANETSLHLFSQVGYADLIPKYSQSQQSPYRDFLNYSEAMKWLNIYFISFQLEDKQKFLDAISNVTLDDLENEIKFRRGHADHNTTQIDDNDDFFNLYQNDNRSFYYQASPEAGKGGIEEAYFWLGTVQFISNQNEGIENLHNFVQLHLNAANNNRMNILLDYARYWRGMLYLEEYRNNPSRLQDLSRFLTEFEPQVKTLEIQIDLLQNLTQLELGEDIWEDVLNAEESTDWFQEAAKTIQYLLQRAATVVGRNRMHYLQQLNRIFYYTNFQKSNETTFYQGIAKSLEAEIQGDEDDKKKMFQESADLLSTVEEPYKNEASYIRGRSLFFAEKYDKAKDIFRRLINQEQSLRSLYYYAEILRQSGYGEAAKKCYEVIKEKTRAESNGKFWFVNADAAINLVVNRKEGTEQLQGLNYQDVTFPDQFLDQSYEKMAERKFVRFQYLQESLDLLKKFALPKKTNYITQNAPHNSIFKTNAIKAIPPIFDEILRRETSILDIFVMHAGEAPAPIKVMINQKQAKQIHENHFQSQKLNVGDQVTITINKKNFYDFQQSVNIKNPRKQIVNIPLTEKTRLISTSFTKMPLNYLSFPNRLDQNVLIKPNDFKLSSGSKLSTDLSNELKLRDMAYHQKLNKFMVVDMNRPDALRCYNESGDSASYFSLQFNQYDSNSLREPEGIAIDYNSNIYITDFAKHRVVVFDSSGNYQYHFGEFGRNTAKDSTQTIKLTFPTRITIEEDYQGLEASIQGEKTRVFRMPFILVADRYGIHRCDINGNYIETTIQAQDENFRAGQIYAFGVHNYGPNSAIYLGLRKDDRILKFSAKPVE